MIAVAANWIEGWEAMTALLSAIAGLFVVVVRMLRKVTAQVEPNGGSSLADRIARIDEAVAVEGARARFMAHQHPDCFFEADAKGLTIFANRALAKLYGLPTHELRERRWLRAVHEADRVEVWRSWEVAVREGIPYEATYRIVRPDGETFRVRARAQACEIGGRTLRFFGTVTREDGPDIEPARMFGGHKLPPPEGS